MKRWCRHAGRNPPGRKQCHWRPAPPITTVEAEALIQRVGITAEQFKEVLAALTPNREIVVEDETLSLPARATSRRRSRRGESTATSKIGSEERQKAVEDNEAAELWRMYERLDAQNPYRQAVFSEVTPFSRRIMSCPLPDNFKTPQIKAYNGTTDPQDHLARFEANVVMYAYPEEIKCRCFLATLEGQACEWFHKLPKRSIDKWSDLAHKFLEHFASSRRQKLPFSHLLNVKIRKGEQLREFINRWEKEARDVQGADDQEMLARAKYLALEAEDDEPPVRKEKKSGPPVAEGKKRKDYGKGPNPTGYHANRHLVHAVQSLPAPPHSRESYGVQEAPKYCEYHRNSTHNTSECVTLKKEMDQLIAKGPPPRSERPSSSNRTWRRLAAPTAAITAGEGQEDGRRHLGRDCDDLDEEERPPLPKRKKKEPMVFTDEDYPPVLNPHRDALVIKVEINNVVVHRTLVDTGCSVNVMYSNTFKELGMSRSDLKPIHTPLLGFTGDTIEAEGTITVKAGVGDGTHRLWLDMEFMVVHLDCAHHLILGRPGATKSQARVDENVSTICAAIQKEEGRPRVEPADEIEEVTLDPARPEQKVKVGKTLPPRLKEQLLEVLQAFKVLFAWGPEDMPGVDPRIICHRLAVDPTHKPIKQKKRFLSSERRDFVTKQVTTLQSIGHIREVRYPECPNAPSRVSKWGVFLGSFQIEFKPRPAIKGQALADFVVECTAREEESNGEEPEGNWWTVYTDGSSAIDASGGGVVAISPEGFKAYYSVRFRFKVSNNEAEYEALLCGLRLAASLKDERIQVRCDSKLIVGHVTREFEAKDERMKKYRDAALELLKAFGAYQIEQVPREENAEADILSKLGPDSPDHIKVMTQEEELLEPSISPGQVLVITLKEPDWIDEITMYILDGSLPTDPIAAKGNRKQHVPGGRDRLLYQVVRGCPHADHHRRADEEVCIQANLVPIRAVGYPQANGQVENTNRTIVDGLKKKIMECKSAWVEELPYILWTYRTTPRKATGETPFSLTYGFEARAPAETSLLSYRVETFDAQENEENLRAELLCGLRDENGAGAGLVFAATDATQSADPCIRVARVGVLQLHLIDERRERAYIRAENYHRQVKSYHDQRVRPRQFRVGDWVLRKREEWPPPAAAKTHHPSPAVEGREATHFSVSPNQHHLDEDADPEAARATPDRLGAFRGGERPAGRGREEPSSSPHHNLIFRPHRRAGATLASPSLQTRVIRTLMLQEGQVLILHALPGHALQRMERAWGIPVNPPVRQTVGRESLVCLAEIIIRIWGYRRQFHRWPLPTRQPAAKFVGV
ncbi:unnamed protein product [Cuscuta campestris]|uniref:RNase H type-1 domain-containing protein n=1 Tax=Cuscuta campestris TaxID=132261 RepID=A0A484L6L8_9ASTE|nr:unnamed protein product [Cuscuta campestris]